MIKKLSILFAALSALFAISCTPAEETPEEAYIATYYLTTNQTEVLKLAENRSRDVNVNVKTVESVGGEANLTFTLTADLALVDEYNKANNTNYQAMPSSAYSIEPSTVTVNRFGTNSTTAKVSLKAKDIEAGITYVLPVSIGSVEGGEYYLDSERQTVYLLLELAIEVASDYSFMSGLYDDPCTPAGADRTPDYTIKTVEDMKNLRNILVDGETKYVVLDADIDMSSITDWTGLNLDSGFKKGIEFNGQGHTISNFTCNSGSYRSFFGIMNGRMYNVTFENPIVDGTAGGGTQPCAIIAAYGGNKSGMIEAIIHDVKIKNATVKGKAGGVGGIVGVAANTIVKRCLFDGEIDNTGGRRTGGIVGYHNVAANDSFLRIEDCASSGSVISTQNVGGIIGQTQYSGKTAGGYSAKVSVVANCISTMYVGNSRSTGGIVGTASYGGSFAETIAADLVTVKDMIVKCLAWNDKIDAPGTSTSNYSSGAVVGYCNIYQYFYDCYRKASMDFVCPISADGSKLFDIALVDQPNSGGDINTLYVGTKNDEESPYTNYEYCYPYHGKAAANATAIAKALGWSEDVWDFSGAVPTLK